MKSMVRKGHNDNSLCMPPNLIHLDHYVCHDQSPSELLLLLPDLEPSYLRTGHREAIYVYLRWPQPPPSSLKVRHPPQEVHPLILRSVLVFHLAVSQSHYFIKLEQLTMAQWQGQSNGKKM